MGRKESDARSVETTEVDGAGVTKYGWAHLLPYAPPWGVAVIVYLAGLFAHDAWAQNPIALGFASAGTTVAAGVLTAVAWKAGGSRNPLTQIHATLSIAFASMWILMALIIGAGRPVLDVWAIGAGTIAATWNIRRALRGHGDGSGWAEFAQKTKLAKTRVQHPVIDGAQIKADLALRDGQTIAEVQSAAPQMASALGVPPNGVRITGDPDNAARGKMTVTAVDMLRQRHPWPGPSAPGTSIAEAIPFGVYEDSTRAKLWLPGDHKADRNATLLLIGGMAGAGKTKGAQLIVSEIGSRRDALVVAADPVKGEQTLRPVRDALTVAATTMADAKKLLKRLRTAARNRANLLGQMGLSQWEEGCGIPYVVAWLEEAAAYINSAGAFVDLAREVRSTGIGLMVSVQRASYRAIPVDARQQMGGGLCFGVDDVDDASFVLSETTVDAGARPDAWGTRKPGCAYLEAPGIPEDYWTVPLRTNGVDDDALAQSMRYVMHPDLDDRTRSDLGDLLDDTRHSVTIPVGSVSRQPRPTEHEPTDPLIADMDDAADAVDGDLDDDELTLPANAEPGFADDIDPSKEIPEDDDPELELAVRTPVPELTATEARDALVKYLNQLYDTGQATVSPASMAEWRIAKLGKSRSWLSRKLAEMAEAGFLEPTGDAGWYRVAARIELALT